MFYEIILFYILYYINLFYFILYYIILYFILYNFTRISKVCSRGYGRVDIVALNFLLIILSHFVFIYFAFK